jgi:hypothetical protein
LGKVEEGLEMALARGIEGRVTGKAGAALLTSSRCEEKRVSTRERNGSRREDKVGLRHGHAYREQVVQWKISNKI